MNDYPDIYTNEIINSVEEDIDMNIRDISVSTAIKLN